MGLKVFAFKKRSFAINRVGQLKAKIAYCCTRSSTRCHLPSSSSPFDALTRRGSARHERKIRADRRLPRRRLQLRPQVRHTPPRRRTLQDLAGAPSQLAIRPRGKERKKEWNHAVRWLHARTHARTRANAFPPTQNAPRTHHRPIRSQSTSLSPHHRQKQDAVWSWAFLAVILATTAGGLIAYAGQDDSPSAADNRLGAACSAPEFHFSDVLAANAARFAANAQRPAANAALGTDRDVVSHHRYQSSSSSSSLGAAGAAAATAYAYVVAIAAAAAAAARL